MNRRGRIVLGLLFVVCMTVCGLVAGAFVGGNFLVPRGSGLAGGAMVLGYGVAGAVLFGAIGGLLAYVLSPKWFLGAALPVTIAGIGLGIVLVNGYLGQRAQMQADLDLAYDKLNRFKVALVHLADEGAPFARMEADWGTRRYTAVTTDARPRTCTAALSGREAVSLLEALRAAEAVMVNGRSPCDATQGTAERELDWFIPEAKPPDSRGRHAITAACAAGHPALAKPFEAAAAIFRSGDNPMDCR